ncbi:citrate synthase [Lentisphaera profundi]|uniref:Citrate synthase n=1 Tax=Lentisphaera profundi TaxID=1658616 RepID=A0ABY7VTE1_9BACT|nr:citrate synthase [Lentisphaera profundi]WDE97024.1 citrate synthase [Lentisphaera profundi]
MSDSATLNLAGKTLNLPIIEGTENEKAIDISALRKETGYVTFDPGYGNTCPSKSSITFLNGEAGALRYRGYTIAELCEKHTFEEASYLTLYGELPTTEQLKEFTSAINEHRKMPKQLEKIFDAYPDSVHPMVMINVLTSSLSAYYPEVTAISDPAQVEKATQVAIGQMLTFVAFAYRKSIGASFEYPTEPCSTAAGLLKMMFGNDYEVDPDVEKVIDELLILHVDHEFNCSTSAVRLIGSSQANLFASISGGISALWGPLHGGANQAVVEMLEYIHANNIDPQEYLEKVKRKEDGIRLMGFGHRVYKNYDPRARIIKKTCDRVMAKLGQEDPLLAIAQKLEAAALSDEYFTSRKLYPNVDFYSGIVYRAIKIPTEIFTPLFALGRLPGWIAHWREQNSDPKARIGRPRQIYTGETQR